jgi:DNA-binding HxlR family transcriptional regulator
MTTEPHPRHRLSEIIHQPVRFSILAALVAADSLDFATIRDTVQVSDSVLSKQLSTLADAGVIEVRKAFVGKWPRTSARLTVAGRAAWHSHIAALQEIANAAPDASG